jgi:hypothetical protein
MSYVLPNFNLFVNVWRVLGAGGTYAAPDAQFNCNLSPGKRVMMGIVPVGPNEGVMCMELLLPSGVDVRSRWNNIERDLVEVPAGSERFYEVIQVDDIGKGFANEHRIAWIFYLNLGAQNFAPPILAPVPLP